MGAGFEGAVCRLPVSLASGAADDDLPAVLGGIGTLATTGRPSEAAVVRWAVLIGEFVRLLQVLPAAPPPPRRRRFGEPALPPAAAPACDGALLDGVAGHVLGVLSRCCFPESLARDRRHGTPAMPAAEADLLEARMMVALADHMFCRRMGWAGWEAWAQRRLGPRLLGGEPLDDAARTALHARLAAGDARFTEIMPALLGLGLGHQLFPDDRARRLLALVPPANPPVDGTARCASPTRGARRQRAIVLVAGLLAAAGLLGWQYVVWQTAVARLAGQFAGGG